MMRESGKPGHLIKRVDRLKESKRLEEILSKLPSRDRAHIEKYLDRDGLTGVYDRGKFDYDYRLIANMTVRNKQGAALFMIDIDHFKVYNDTHGHVKGDELLVNLAECIGESLRDYDNLHFYRYGGEEFVIIFPQITSKIGYEIAERIRKNVKELGVTISVGVAHYKETSGKFHDLLEDADKAMYEAKRAGRDKVILHEK